jgi:hypothetical protein
MVSELARVMMFLPRIFDARISARGRNFDFDGTDKKQRRLKWCAMPADGTITARSIARGFRHFPLQGQLSTGYATSRAWERGLSPPTAHIPSRHRPLQAGDPVT